MQLLLKTLLYLSYFSVLAPMYLLYKVNAPTEKKLLKALGLLLGIAALSDLLGFIFIKSGSANIPIDNIYFLIQFFILSYIYSILLKNKRMVSVISVLFGLLILINMLFVEPITRFQNQTLVLENLVLIFYSLTGYIQLHNYPPKDEQSGMLALWFNIAVLFYFGMNLFLFGTFNYILTNETAEVAITSWSFHNLCNIIKNVFFATGIYYAGMPAAVKLKSSKH